MQVAQALASLCGCTCRTDRRDKESDQHGKDRNNDQKFHQRETGMAGQTGLGGTETRELSVRRVAWEPWQGLCRFSRAWMSSFENPESLIASLIQTLQIPQTTLRPTGLGFPVRARPASFD